MPKNTVTPEQIVGKSRQIEVLVSQGMTVPAACAEAGIVEQTFYRERYVNNRSGGTCFWEESGAKIRRTEVRPIESRRAISDLLIPAL